MSESTIEVKGIYKQYSIGQRETGYLVLSEILGNIAKKLISAKIPFHNNKSFWALKNVSFKVEQGEILGMIGANGAGKTTLLKILSRITPPTKGEIRLRGRMASLLEVGTGFHPELTGRENIFLNGAILGMTRQEIKSKLEEIVEFSGVSKFINTPIKHYSSGMQVRLAFSVAAHLDFDILLVDEVLAVGDAEFQRKSLGKMQDVSSQGKTIIFISHNLPAITSLCKRVILLEKGKVIKVGTPEKVISYYLSKASLLPYAEVGDSSKYTNNFLRLTAVKVNQEGRVMQSFDITKDIKIDTEYEVFESNVWFSCHILLRDSSGLVIFQSPEDTNRDPKNIVRVTGKYRSTCFIPGNFLSEGMFSIRVIIDSHSGQGSDIVDFNNIISFYVIDHLKGNSVRGKENMALKGVIRPKLKWARVRIA